MRVYDQILADLAAGISALPPRNATLLFAAAAKALQPEYQAWAAHSRAPSGMLLERALTVAFELVLVGRADVDLVELLDDIEGATPGESPDWFPSTNAQDCLICADVAIRVNVDRSFAAGPVVEYALEPVLQAASERLFRVTSLGGGPDEQAQEAILLDDDRVVGAIASVRDAITLLRRIPEPDQATVDEICAGMLALCPT
jgi:hypothetical protein